ncbi:MAG TPA: hypothetical protein VFA56_11565 [Gaiellaceae bacterium]|nr:hypothetical protein [Gaiellaceae bacterium]
MNEMLDELVPRDERPGDWDDVLRRARRRRLRPRAVAAVVVAAGVLVATPAVAVLTRDTRPRLPDGADRSDVMAVVQPDTGRLLVEIAPWKGHDGFCYLVLQRRSGCVANTHTQATAVLSGAPLFAWSFGNRRIRSATATTRSGKHVPLLVTYVGGRIDAAIITARGRLPLLFGTIVLRDRSGHPIATIGR